MERRPFPDQTWVTELLRRHGLPTASLVRADNALTSTVWMTRDAVVKAATAGRHLEREQRVLTELARRAPSLPIPRVTRSDMARERSWIIEGRLLGVPLLDQWLSLGEDARRTVIFDLGRILKHLHHATERARPTRLGRALYRQIEGSARQLQGKPGIDPEVLREALVLAEAGAALVDQGGVQVLVHNDLQFNNILINGTRISGLVDFGRARRGPPDLDLDLFLRFLRHPRLFARAKDEDRLDPKEFLPAAGWLCDVYPELFSAPHLRVRLALYRLHYDFRALARRPELALSSRADMPCGRIRATLGTV